MLPTLNRQTAQINTSYPERVVQFGGGSFLRAFFDWIVETLNDQTDFASSVVIVKLTKQGAYDELNRQEGLFHVRLHGLNSADRVTQTTLITCVNRSIHPYQAFEAFLSLARQADIRFIVSNSTEHGIAFDLTCRFEDRPPAAFPAKLTRFLFERYRHFAGNTTKGCIVLPCELIEQNGDQLKQIILKYAALWQLGDEFADWITTSNVFCNTLVDRIVSGFPQHDSRKILEQLGFDDRLFVEGEAYHAWIIEAPSWFLSEFPVNQTNLNVHVVADIAPYRKMKVRILNGTHTAMVPLGCLLGLKTVSQVIEHPALGPFIHDLLLAEIVPSLVLDEALPYAEAVFARFRNPVLQHQLQSIALNSLSKFKVRLLPSLIDYRMKNESLPKRIVFAFAALLRFYKGEWNDEALPLNDDPVLIAWLRQLWATDMPAYELTTRVLSRQTLWGMDLTTVPELTAQVSSALQRIDTDGVLSIIEDTKWLQSDGA